MSTHAGRAGPTASGPPAALEVVHGPVEALLESFLTDRVAELARMDPSLESVGREVADFARRSGKRLRPAFVYWGHRATGAPHDDAVFHPAGAVELLHTFALIHDDVMDRSPARRGRPTVHIALSGAHARDGLHGDPDWFGVGGAILAGDLAFVWADQLLDAARVPPDALDRARRVFTDLRIEVMAGQYLDLRLAGRPDAAEADSMRVALLKSGRYTVTRPLLLGAALHAPGDDGLETALRTFGDAVGLAFQLRDDVLGLFGDPERTGKGALEDLREGKRTMLVVRALGMAAPADREELTRMLGSADLTEVDAERARDVVASSGALDAVERLLDEQYGQALAALEPVDGAARAALTELADLAAYRVA